MTTRTRDNAGVAHTPSVRIMSKSKAPDDRPKAPKQVRIRQPLYEALERLVARNGSDLTEEANRLIRLGLEREGYWPPPVQGQ